VILACLVDTSSSVGRCLMNHAGYMSLPCLRICPSPEEVDDIQGVLGLPCSLSNYVHPRVPAWLGSSLASWSTGLGVWLDESLDD